MNMNGLNAADAATTAGVATIRRGGDIFLSMNLPLVAADVRRRIPKSHATSASSRRRLRFMAAMRVRSWKSEIPMTPRSQSGDKSRALQTLRDDRAPSCNAKRLECARLQRRFQTGHANGRVKGCPLVTDF
jgi:hypothetical protein